MAAAVVPSRARHRARDSSGAPTDVSYVRLTLAVDAVHGAPQGSYFVRWTRGSAAKVSAARTLGGSGSFGESLSMYARVKREDGALVSADEVPDLSSKLELVRLAPGTVGDAAVEEAQVVGNVDIGYLLQTMADSGKKNTRTSVRFEDGSLAELTVSSKALGEGTLSSLGADPDAETPPEEERVDSELVNMRNALRLRADQIDALTLHAQELNGRIQSAEQRPASASASADELHALSERVRDLEAQKTVVEKQRTDAQKKVDAHVAHAAKIKSTYNQLAGWYNNLRSEYAELQARAKSQGSSDNSFSGGPVARQLSEGGAVREEDYEKLRAERDALRRELDQEREEPDENSTELLAAKEKALEGIRMQWDSAKSDILAAEQNAAEHRRAAEQAIRELEDTKTLLEDARSQMATALVKTRREAERLQEQKKLEVEEARHQIKQEYRRIADEEMEHVERRHAEVISNLANQSIDKDEKLINVEKRLSEATEESEKLKSEVENLKLSQTSEQKLMQEQAEQLSAEAEKARKEEVEKLAKEKDDEITTLKQLHDVQLAALHKDKDEIVERGLATEEEKSGEVAKLQEENSDLRAELEATVEDAKIRADSLSDQVAKLQEQMAALQRENQKTKEEGSELANQKSELEETLRSVQGTQQQTETLLQEAKEDIEALHQQNVAKDKEANKMIRLLEEFEAENDDQRKLVARLRKERDEVRTDLQEAKQSSKHGEREQRRLRDETTGLQEAHKAEIEHLKEERDQSIRELFKVRKSLNSELKQIKKDRMSVQQETVEVRVAKDQLESKIAEQEAAISSIREENEEMKKLIENAKTEASERETTFSKDRDAVELVANERVAKLQSELENINKELVEAREAVQKAAENAQAEKYMASAQENELRDAISKLQAEENSRKLAVVELEENVATEQREREKVLHDLNVAVEKLTLAQDKEEKSQRDIAAELAKSAALSGELISLKESMAAVKGSSSSTEEHLRNAQRELAEVRAQKESLVSDVSSLTTASEAAAVRAKETEARLASEVETAEERATVLNDDLHQQKKRNLELETKLSGAEQESARSLAQITVTTEQFGASRTETARLQKEIHTLQSKMNDMTVNLRGSEVEITSLQKSIDTVESAKDRAVSELKLATEKLRMLEGTAQEKTSAVQSLENRIRDRETSLETMTKENREILRQLEEVRDSADASKSELEEQTMSAKLLEENLSSAKAEVETLREGLTKERSARSNKEEEIEQSSTELQELHSKFEKMAEDHDEELRAKAKEVKELQLDMTEKDGTLTALQDSIQDMQAKIQAKDDGSQKLRALLAKMSGDNKQFEEVNKELTDKYKDVKQKLAEESVDKSEIEEELKAVLTEKEHLEDDVDQLQERVTYLEQLEKAAQKDKRDQKRASTMQSELMNQRARAEKAESDNAALRRRNKELSVRVETHTDSVDLSRDQTLELLIDARMKNANDQEEIARMRNELLKVKTADKDGMGSFEKKRSKK